MQEPGELNQSLVPTPNEQPNDQPIDWGLTFLQGAIDRGEGGLKLKVAAINASWDSEYVKPDPSRVVAPTLKESPKLATETERLEAVNNALKLIKDVLLASSTGVYIVPGGSRWEFGALLNANLPTSEIIGDNEVLEAMSRFIRLALDQLPLIDQNKFVGITRDQVVKKYKDSLDDLMQTWNLTGYGYLHNRIIDSKRTITEGQIHTTPKLTEPSTPNQ